MDSRPFDCKRTFDSRNQGERQEDSGVVTFSITGWPPMTLHFKAAPFGHSSACVSSKRVSDAHPSFSSMAASSRMVRHDSVWLHHHRAHYKASQAHGQSNATRLGKQTQELIRQHGRALRAAAVQSQTSHPTKQAHPAATKRRVTRCHHRNIAMIELCQQQPTRALTTVRPSNNAHEPQSGD